MDAAIAGEAPIDPLMNPSVTRQRQRPPLPAEITHATREIHDRSSHPIEEAKRQFVCSLAEHLPRGLPLPSCRRPYCHSSPRGILTSRYSTPVSLSPFQSCGLKGGPWRAKPSLQADLPERQTPARTDGNYLQAPKLLLRYVQNLGVHEAERHRYNSHRDATPHYGFA